MLGLRSARTLEAGTWGTIGGALEPGEDWEDAAVRELREEAGIIIDRADCVPGFVFRDGGFTYRNFVGVVDDEVDPCLDGELDGARWVRFGEWPTPLHFGMRAWLRDPHASSALQALALGAVK